MHTQTSGTFKDMDAKTESAAWKSPLTENSITYFMTWFPTEENY